MCVNMFRYAPLNSGQFQNNLFGTYSEEKEENNIDPDDGNSWICMACKLPIFSTPFKQISDSSSSSSNASNNLDIDNLVHDECSNPPQNLQHTVWRRSSSKRPPLVLLPNSHQRRCSICFDICGNVLYRCRDGYDDLTLDLKCAMTIKIVHRSHDHRLMVVRTPSDVSFPCGVCGTTHRPGVSWAQPVPLVYMCSACSFWLHPHCALLPNAILLLKHPHPHPLLLNYTWTLFFILKNYWSLSTCPCAICGENIESRGAYSCTMCDFYVHIMCAVADNHSFESVLIRNARFPELIHFPIPDEYTSVVRHIRNNSSSSASSDDVYVHQHPLTLNHHDDLNKDEDEEDDGVRPSCNACVQVISPPFYTCAECPNLFLHDCCAKLPKKLEQNPHFTLDDAAAPRFKSVICCICSTTGFGYDGISMAVDAMCAIMPALITHDAHSKTHILYSSFANAVYTQKDIYCKCCGKILMCFFYYCGTCQNFNIHAKCARLPRTVRHVYDKHPLELVTDHDAQGHSHELFCDACEEKLDHSRWYYRCHQCDQSFHVDCIPCLDKWSLIQFGKPELRLRCHKCPLARVRGQMVRGRRCGYCRELLSNDPLAYECTKCNYWIHIQCAYTKDNYIQGV